jgi:hypothetical protein
MDDASQSSLKLVDVLPLNFELLKRESKSTYQ